MPSPSGGGSTNGLGGTGNPGGLGSGSSSPGKSSPGSGSSSSSSGGNPGGGASVSGRGPTGNPGGGAGLSGSRGVGTGSSLGRGPGSTPGTGGGLSGGGNPGNSPSSGGLGRGPGSTPGTGAGLGGDSRSGLSGSSVGRSTPGMGPPSAFGGVNSGFSPGTLSGWARDAIARAVTTSMAPNPNGFATPSLPGMLGITSAQAQTAPAPAAPATGYSTPAMAPTSPPAVSFTAKELGQLADIQAKATELGATGFSFSDNEDGTSNVDFGFADTTEDGSLNVTVTRDFSVPTDLADKVSKAMTANTEAGYVGVMGDSRRAPTTGTPSKATTSAESRQGSTFGSPNGAPTSSSSRSPASLGDGLGSQASKAGGSPMGTPGGAAIGSATGSVTGSGADSVAGKAMRGIRGTAGGTTTSDVSGEPSIAATSLPGGTMTDAPSVPDVAQPDTTVAAPAKEATGSWENRFGTGRSYFGSDTARSGADSIQGKPTKDARATAMRDARTENPAAFVAATVLAELDPPQLKSLLGNADSQLEAKKILDVIANRALLGGSYTKGNGPLGGALGESGKITAESLSDATAANMQFSPVNLTGDKAAKEANQRVMDNLAGKTNQAEMAMVLGMIDQMTQGGYTPATLDTHYFSKYMTKAPGWAKGMTRTKAGGHIFGTAEPNDFDALVAAQGNMGAAAASGEPTRSEIADRIAKAIESPGVTAYDKEGNSYYKDGDGNLVDAKGNIVQESKTATPETTSGDEGDLGQLHTKTDPNRVGAPDLDGLNEDTKQAVVDLQKAWGKQLTIVSGFRGKGRNAKAGGAKKSQHLSGKAVDIDASDMTVAEKTQLISLASAMGFGGIGVYSGGSLHLDTRDTPAMWGDDHTSKSVPKGFRGVKAAHLGGKFKGRADEFARATDTGFSAENQNLPERNPFTAEQSRIAQGLKDAPDSSVAPTNDATSGFAKNVRDAIAKATADPLGTALGGATVGGTGQTSAADAGIGPIGAVPAPERNPSSIPGLAAAAIGAQHTAAADSSYGRHQVDAVATAKEAYDATVRDMAQKVAEIRDQINAGVTGMPATAFDVGRRQVSGQALGDAQAAATEAAKTAEMAPGLNLGKVQRGEADMSVAGFEAGKSTPTATADTQFAERDKAPFSLDAALGKPGVLNGKVATLSNTVASVARMGTRQGLIAADKAETDTTGIASTALDGLSVARATQAVARATQAGVKSAAANTAKTAELASRALAEANARIDAAVAQTNLSAAAKKGLAQGLKDAAAAQVAQAVKGKVGQLASAAGAYSPTKQGTSQAVADVSAELASAFEQGQHYTDPDQVAANGTLTGPAGLTGAPTDPVSGLPVSGMPSDQAIADSQKTVETKKSVTVSPETQKAVAKVQDTARKQVKETSERIAKTSLSPQAKAEAFTKAVDAITEAASRGVDALLRQEARKKEEEAAKAKAEAEKKNTGKAKKKPAVDPFALALAQYMAALQQAA